MEAYSGGAPRKAFRGPDMDTHQVEQLYSAARSVGPLDRHIGGRLRARRIFRQMSEDWLANALGIGLDELEAMEAGSLRIGPRRLAFIAVALDVADRYFFMDFVPTAVEGERRPGWLRDVDCWFRDRVAPHESSFLSMARGLVGSTGAARDLLHDVYAKVLAGDHWRTIDNPKSYLQRAVYTSAQTFLAKNRVAPLPRDDGYERDVIRDEAPGPDLIVEDRDHLRRVMAALMKLPPQCRRVMIMRKVDGLSGREIAARLGITLKGVEIHLTRGMIGLNKHLEADNVGTGLYSIVRNKSAKPDTSLAD